MAIATAKVRGTSRIAVKSAAYSRAELKLAQEKITLAAAGGRSDIQAVGIADDGSGLAVERRPPAATPASVSATLAPKSLPWSQRLVRWAR